MADCGDGFVREFSAQRQGGDAGALDERGQARRREAASEHAAVGAKHFAVQARSHAGLRRLAVECARVEALELEVGPRNEVVAVVFG